MGHPVCCICFLCILWYVDEEVVISPHFDGGMGAGGVRKEKEASLLPSSLISPGDK